MKRQRGRGRRSNGASNNPNRHFESTGPDVKIRGSAQQILDKYLQYARDAQSSGDRINAENYFQHAEHYARVLAAMQPKEKPRRDDRGDGDGGEADADGAALDASDGDEDIARDAPAEAGDGADALKVIDSGPDETAPAETVAAEPSEEADAPKPRRRRQYKRKSEEPAADAPDALVQDGVMATLSRGRPADDDPAAPAEAEPVDDGEAPAKAAG